MRTFKYTVIPVILAMVLFGSLALAQTTNPGTFRAPTVKTGATTTSIYWTAGTINNGGHAVAITAGSAALGASKTACTPPGFSACDILYANSAGTVAVTTDIFVARAVGNSVLAYVETSAGSVPTNIVMPLQSSSVWSASASPQVSYTETSATPGTVRVVRGEATTAATMTSGNLVGVRGAVTAPTGGAISGSYLYGTQGKIITGTATISGTAIAGIYGQIDVTGGTLSGGNNAAVQANIYGATSGSWTNLDGIYVEHAGGGVINSLMRLFGKSDYVFDIASNTHTQMGLTGAATTAAGWLKIKVEGSTRYINLWSTAP